MTTPTITNKQLEALLEPYPARPTLMGNANASYTDSYSDSYVISAWEKKCEAILERRDAAAPDLARLVLEKDAEIARLNERIEHAHNTARRFYDTNKSNAGKYFLHICDILEPHCQAMKETSDE